VIRTDNGVPFATQAVGGLSQLAVWWLRLGIRLERTRRGKPQDNGAHERMHRMLKQEATRPPRTTPELQQRAFDRFRDVFNPERPHQALGQVQPGKLYRPSPRLLPGKLPQFEYPDGTLMRRVRKNGDFKCWGRRYFLSMTLARQTVGFRLSDQGLCEVFFGPALLAELNAAEQVLTRIGTRLPPAGDDRECYLC
jgi:putative transposase